MNTRRVWPVIAACAAVVVAGIGAPGSVSSAGATDRAATAAATADPFDVVYDVELDNAKAVRAGRHPLAHDAYRKVTPTHKNVQEPAPHDPGRVQPALLDLLATGDPAREVDVVLTYPDTLEIPLFPAPVRTEGRDGPHNKLLLAEARRLVDDIRTRRADAYRQQTAVLNQLGGHVEQTYWLIQGVRATLPLGRVPALLQNTDVRYVELADGVAGPPTDTDPDNDTFDARRQINSDSYYALNQTTGFIGLLDTGVRETHDVFNGPDHLAIVDDLTGDADPSDQCNHGTSSAALITGNSSLGTDWRGLSAISVDSWDVYGDDCLVGAADTVTGIETAVVWLDEVIVAEVQINASETSSSSTAADNAYDAGSVVVAANGNFGPNSGTVRAPANAHKVLGIGAADLKTDALMSYSSRGPTADSRYKPDLVFPTGVETASNASDTGARTFTGTSCATPIAGGSMALLRNWQAGSAGSVDAGHVYSRAILYGQQTYAFDNNTGAGAFQFGLNGDASWGKVNISSGTQVDIPITVSAGQALIEGSLWWPESTTLHNDVDLYLVDPSGNEQVWSLSGVSVFERAGVTSGAATGGWTLSVRAYSVTGTQPVYWSARTR
jgi:serine protease AprX